MEGDGASETGFSMAGLAPPLKKTKATASLRCGSCRENVFGNRLQIQRHAHTHVTYTRSWRTAVSGFEDVHLRVSKLSERYIVNLSV